jgi:MoxR-like ATPase
MTSSWYSVARCTSSTAVAAVITPSALARHQNAAQAAYVDRRVMEYAVALTTATRDMDENGWVEFGASPRGALPWGGHGFVL